MSLEIIPAILEKDSAKLKEKIKSLKGSFSWLQLDLGDGNFVPKTFWDKEAFKKTKGSFNWEAHLMVENPRAFIDDLKEVGFKRIIFHIEPFFQVRKKTREFDVNNLIRRIRGIEGIQERIEVGIAINPGTSPNHIVAYVERIDEVLILSVNPGKQGQQFNPQVLAKINFLKNLKPDLKIGVDGGINDKNIREISLAGADRVYVGSYLWQNDNLERAINKLKSAIK